MKKLIAPLTSAILLSACWGAPPNERILTQLCTDLFEGDEHTERVITRQGQSDLASFCACYAAQVVTTPELIDKHKDILNVMNEVKESGADNVEDVAEQVEEMTKDGRVDTFTEAELEALGDYYQDLTGEMSSADGACPS